MDEAGRAAGGKGGSSKGGSKGGIAGAYTHICRTRCCGIHTCPISHAHTCRTRCGVALAVRAIASPLHYAPAPPVAAHAPRIRALLRAGREASLLSLPLRRAERPLSYRYLLRGQRGSDKREAAISLITVAIRERQQ
jgi:hypothetical protein